MEHSPTHGVRWLKSVLPLLRSGPENHGQAEYADKDHVASKVKKNLKKLGVRLDLIHVPWGCLTPYPGLSLLVSKQSGALPFAEGRHAAGD